MFAIKRGRVAVMVDGNTVDTLADEEISGEMALLDHGTRTASVVTLEETQLLSEWLRRADALYPGSSAR